MAYTVQKLITNAYYLSGVVARELQTVSGGQAADGLDLLNDILALKTANTRLIPYYSFETIDLVIGQQDYFVPRLLQVSSLTFNIEDVRFAMSAVGRRDYFGNSRANNINALPLTYHVEREKGGSRIYVYFSPDSNYPLHIVGRYGLDEVDSLAEDLSTTYDRIYIAYLKYALAQYICEEYNLPFTPQADQKLREYEQILLDVSALDFKMQKSSTFSKQPGLSWWDVNIGKGYRPS